jgi:Domain of unknown function (DUF1905)/Bacteriocin-protection, YdeI or OmpD-Associated
MNSPSTRKKFKAVLENPEEGIDAAFVSIPFDVEEVFGTKGHVKVKALFDGQPYRGILANMGTGGHVIIVRKDIREAIRKKVGDMVTVEIEEDLQERVVEVPEDLKKLLTRNTKAKTFFDSLSYTNRKEYAGWISGAKKTETRERRLKETIAKLLKGMKNPSQK